MKNSIILILMVGLVSLLGQGTNCLAAGQSSTDYTIVSDVFSGGGATVTSTNYTISGTIGQPAIIGTSGSTDYDLNHGFWAQIPQACLNHGDTNGSGGLTAEDAQITFFIVLGMVTPTASQICAADCDGNGSITAADAQLIFLSLFGDSCVDEIPGSFDTNLEMEILHEEKLLIQNQTLSAAVPTDDILWIEFEVNSDEQMIHADLTIENPVTTVDAFTMEILFDAEKYEFVQFKEGSIFTNWFEFECREIEPGRVVVAAYTVDDEIPMDSLGSLVHVTFEQLDYRWNQNDFEFILMDDLAGFSIE